MRYSSGSTASKLLLPLCIALALGACSDGNNNNKNDGGTPPDPNEPGTTPISIETPNADRCEILDSDNCMFPWPSSVFTVADDAMLTGQRINLSTDSMPKNKQGVPVDTTEWNRNDGFSPSQMMVAQVPGVDMEQTGAPPITDLEQSLSPDSPIVVINAGTGEQHLIFAELDANTDDPAEQTLLIRPMVQFERGGRYIVALRNMRDANGDLLEAPEVFRAFRDDTLTNNAAIESRRDAMEAIFSTLGDAGVNRDELYLAWEFTVASAENITGRVIHIRDDAFADLGGAAPGFTVDEVVDYAPCSESGCEAGQDAYKSRAVIGTFQVPNYLASDDGGPGVPFYYAQPDDGLPDRMGGDNMLTAKFYCSIPRSVAEDFDSEPKAIARPSLYGHGLLGSGDEALRGTGSNIIIMGNDHQMVFCGTDWIGFSEEDIGYAIQVLQDFSLFQNVFDRQQQSFLNFMYLARLLKHDEGFRTDPAFQAGGEPVFDNSTVYYDGNSQGGIMGGALMGVIQDVTRGVLGVPGMSYSMLLRRSVDFDLYKPFFSGAGTGDNGGGYPSIKDQSFLLSMVQMLWDRGESSGYVYHIQDNLLPNTPAHSVLMHVAYGDHQVSMWTAEFMARSIGAKLRIPALEDGRHPDSNSFYALEPVPAGDYTGSVLVYWDNGPLGGGAADGGTKAPPIDNTPPFEPDFGADPHSLPRKDTTAQQQKSYFLMPDGEGKFVDTCDPALPCTTDGYVPGSP